MAGPTRVPPYAKGAPCSATCGPISTSPSDRGRRCCCRCTRRLGRRPRLPAEQACARGGIDRGHGRSDPRRHCRSDPRRHGRSVRATAYLLRHSHPRAGAAMSLCFIEPQNAIRVIADSVGREARRQILGEVVRAWVDEIPESELESHYAKAVADLDEHDLSMLAAWHASLEVGHPVPTNG